VICSISEEHAASTLRVISTLKMDTVRLSTWVPMYPYLKVSCVNLQKCENLKLHICYVYLLQKNRKLIPCYWENQPGGCRKPHCSFQHKNPREQPTVADMEKAKEC